MTVVDVTISDYPQVQALLRGAARALTAFASLSDDQKTALPEAVQAGIGSLAEACQGTDAEPARDMTPYFSIVIEWGRPHGDKRPLPGWDTAIYDTASGDLLPGVSRLRLVDVDAQDVLKAELTMFADEDGNPSAEPHLRDGDVITAVFRVNISEMRVREQAASAPEPPAS